MSIERPKTRAGCGNRPGACPFISCRHHLAVEVNTTGSISAVGVPTWKPPRTDKSKNTKRLVDVFADAVSRYIESGLPTCSLDVAEEGPVILEEIGRIWDVSRERIRQIETKAIRRYQSAMPEELRGYGWVYPEGALYDEAVDGGTITSMVRSRSTLKNLIGQKFGRLLVIARVPGGANNSKWQVECDCGVIKNVHASALRSGATRSCGCLARENSIRRNSAKKARNLAKTRKESNAIG